MGKTKNAAAVALGRKGGAARIARMTPAERLEAGRKLTAARKAKNSAAPATRRTTARQPRPATLKPQRVKAVVHPYICCRVAEGGCGQSWVNDEEGRHSRTNHWCPTTARA